MERVEGAGGTVRENVQMGDGDTEANGGNATPSVTFPQAEVRLKQKQRNSSSGLLPLPPPSRSAATAPPTAIEPKENSCGYMAFLTLLQRTVDTGRPGEEAVGFPVCVVNTFLPDPTDPEMAVEGGGAGNGGGEDEGGKYDADAAGDNHQPDALGSGGGGGSSNRGGGSTRGRTGGRVLGERRVLAERLLRRVHLYLQRTGLLEVPVIIAGGFHGSNDVVYDTMSGHGKYASCFHRNNGREVEVTHHTVGGHYVAADFVWQRRSVVRCMEEAVAVRAEIDLIEEMSARSAKRQQYEQLVGGGNAKGKSTTVAQRRAAATRRKAMEARREKEKEAIHERRRKFNQTLEGRSTVVLRLVPRRTYTLPEHSTDLETMVPPRLHDVAEGVAGIPRADLAASCSPDGLDQWSDVSDHRPLVTLFDFHPGCRLAAATTIAALVRGRQQVSRYAAMASQQKAKLMMAKMATF